MCADLQNDPGGFISTSPHMAIAHLNVLLATNSWPYVSAFFLVSISLHSSKIQHLNHLLQRQTRNDWAGNAARSNHASPPSPINCHTALTLPCLTPPLCSSHKNSCCDTPPQLLCARTLPIWKCPQKTNECSG